MLCHMQVNLKSNQLSPEEGMALALAVSSSASITSVGEGGLDLKDNELGDEGASLTSEGYGPVVTSFGCAPSLTSARVSILTTRRN